MGSRECRMPPSRSRTTDCALGALEVRVAAGSAPRILQGVPNNVVNNSVRVRPRVAACAAMANDDV